MQLRFFGAAGEVTGSCTLIETAQARVLVDFGLHQGFKTAERRNRNVPPIRPGDLDCVVLTHAHLDHSGRLPMLPDVGFKGPIYSTPASIELSEILLEDAAHLQQMDAERKNRHRSARRGRPVTPLYTLPDVSKVMPLFRPIEYDQPREVAPGVTARFVDAGHILGSASVELTVEADGRRKTVVFSGDIGPKGAPLLADPVGFDHADVVVLESTYGDRDHRPLSESIEQLLSILRSARTPGGKVLIPAFAVGRTQNLIYILGDLVRERRLEHPLVYIDSPMATETTTLYRRYRNLFDEESWEIIDAGDTPLKFEGLRYTRTPDQSRALNSLGGGAIIISASGMMNGGRILHHLRHGLSRPETHVIIVGFQAEGTLGRRLVEGAKQVSVLGHRIDVKAQMHTVNGFSAHAGQTELVGWLANMAKSKPRVLLNHGEDRQRGIMAEKIKHDLGLEPETPEFGDIVRV